MGPWSLSVQALSLWPWGSFVPVSLAPRRTTQRWFPVSRTSSVFAPGCAARLVGMSPANREVEGSIPSQGACLCCGGSIPRQGVCERQLTHVSLPLSPTPFPSPKSASRSWGEDKNIPFSHVTPVADTLAGAHGWPLSGPGTLTEMS